MFMKRQQPLDASIFYLAMKKQSLLKTLFKYVWSVCVCQMSWVNQHTVLAN